MAEVTECLAIDCEMVAALMNGRWRRLVARVSIVNEMAQCLYSTYVKPIVGVTNVFHIRTKAPIDANTQKKLLYGQEYNEVRRYVKTLTKDRILVGHAFNKDLNILKLRHPKLDRRDAADYFADEEDERPTLRDLAASELNMTLRDGAHDCTQAAVACMRLYKLYESDWDEFMENESEYEDSSDSS